MFDRFDTALFKAMGLEDLSGVLPPVIEDMSSSTLFVKFMSDGGKRDAEQGRLFKAFLDKNNVPYTQGSQERTFINVAQVRLEGLVGEATFASEAGG